MKWDISCEGFYLSCIHNFYNIFHLKAEERIEAMKEVVRKMLSDNMLFSKIIEMIDLTIEEIQKLKQNECISKF